MSAERIASLVADELTVDRGDRRVINSASFALVPGKSYALVGPSGSGKSTLLAALYGRLRIRSGRLSIGGIDATGLSGRDWRQIRLRKLGIVTQEGDLIPELSAGENVALPLRLAGVSKADAMERASGMLNRLGLGDQVALKAAMLSGGEWQRCAIARALVINPTVLIADEPTGALDGETSSQVASVLLGAARDSGVAVLVATHDSDLAFSVDCRLRVSNGLVDDVL